MRTSSHARFRRCSRRWTRPSSLRTFPDRQRARPTAYAFSRTRGRSRSRRTSTSASPRRAASTSSTSTRTRSPSLVPWQALVAFADAHPRCGIAGPQMRWPDGSWQPSRRRFPTVRGTIVRRTPLRRLHAPYDTQREHYALDERPTEPVEADWMLGAFLLMRRTMLDEIGGWDAGYRHYCEDIDLCYRAAHAGLGALVRARRGRDARVRGRDRPEVPLSPHALARARAWPASSASIRSACSHCDLEGGPVRAPGRRLD